MPAEKVVFRKFREGDIIALFPRLPGTNDPGTCLSYQHIGQHGSADPLIVHDTKLAKPEEYAALAKELRGIGYQLKIAQKCTYDDFLYRKKLIEASRRK